MLEEFIGILLLNFTDRSEFFLLFIWLREVSEKVRDEDYEEVEEEEEEEEKEPS